MRDAASVHATLEANFCRTLCEEGTTPAPAVGGLAWLWRIKESIGNFPQFALSLSPFFAPKLKQLAVASAKHDYCCRAGISLPYSPDLGAFGRDEESFIAITVSFPFLPSLNWV